MTQSKPDSLGFAGTTLPRFTIVFVYATAMAWVESAVVYYLRTMIDRINPYQELPLPLIGNLGSAELVRELATMIMLLTVGWLAGSNLRTRIGYTVMAFGVWDVFYYVFLKMMCGWPATLLDWDLLFLIPLPWWGPVLAPMMIAALMIAWGSLVVFARSEEHMQVSWTAWGACVGGIVLALYVFMQDAIQVAHNGANALRHLLPTQFDWITFAVSLLLMSLPIMRMLRNRVLQRV